MPTSTLGHYVRFRASDINARDPVDSGMAARALGNLNHLADQYAQVRIKWVAPVGRSLQTAAGAETLASGHQRLWTSTPFDLHVRPNGESYRLRLRWLLRGDTAGGSGVDAHFMAAIGPAGDSLSEQFARGPNVAEHALTSASLTWVDHPDLLHLDANLVRRCRQIVPSINEVGGAERNALWLRCELSVWCRVEDLVSDVGALGGLELTEYYAP